MATCRPGTQLPKSASCAASTAGSPGSSRLNAASNAVSSPNRAAFSDACEVQPIERSRAVWKTAARSCWSRPSVPAKAVASAQVRSPFSNGSPVARSVVSESAAKTSVTRTRGMRGG
ncbi:hypothetical protein [Geodermatophilus sp. URMC 64]